MILKDDSFKQRDKLMQELRRGILVLATLSQLKEEKYGYALISDLAERGLASRHRIAAREKRP